jgi:superfamily I DNA/RNA helicase
LCRNTAPLVTLALRLLGAGRGATIAGRDIGKNLTRIVKKISGKASMPIDTFISALSDYIELETQKKPSRTAALRDRQDALLAISTRAFETGGQYATTDNIISIIERLYADKAAGSVFLSTIHRAKGLEWPDVLFLDAHLIPSKYAQQDWQLQQEHNLRYVGVTRAQENLHFCASTDIHEG